MKKLIYRYRCLEENSRLNVIVIAYTLLTLSAVYLFA